MQNIVNQDNIYCNMMPVISPVGATHVSCLCL